MQRTLIALFLAAIILPVSVPAYADTLSGLKVFPADSSGLFVSPLYGYSTYVPNTGKYVPWTTDGDMATGPFINQGPTRDEATLSYLLTPGSHNFYFFAETGLSEGQSVWPGAVPPFWGLNLFFNSEVTQPGISAFAPTSTTASAGSVFSPIVGSTLPLGEGPSVTSQGSLTFIKGGTTVTLTSFAFFDPRVYNSDRISNFDAVPDGNREFVGQFALQVTETPEPTPQPTPEPNTLLLLGSGLMGLLFVGRRRFGIAAAQ